MLANSKTLIAVTDIQKWWKKLLKSYCCRRSQCRKIIPYAKDDGYLCDQCYEERYHPEHGWDNEGYTYYN